MSDIELLQQISDKMDKLLRLQALEFVKNIPEEQRKIELLESLGFRPVEIAKFLNKTPENINVVLSGLRKKKSENKTKPAGKAKPKDSTSNKEDAIVPVSQPNVEVSKK
ncbi:MAG: hypothetical protein NWE95_01720 [Candidatus Bathyarchaeota archaeon]|nr:hypothetical protein [Candidatus Bathyarchaeota archaeon]